MPPRVTRGYGLLEVFLARQRSAMVERLISSRHREGCILDIGCGSYPAFLLGTAFTRKVGLDKALTPHVAESWSGEGLDLVERDLDKDPSLPLESESCDVVTMSAVIEHLDTDVVPVVLSEVFRVLRAHGLCIITAPSSWTDALLKIMAKVRLVSAVEIQDHKALYNVKKILALLRSAGFPAEGMRGGYFELGMNCWAAALKSVPESDLH